MLSVLHVLTNTRNIRDLELMVAICWTIWHFKNLFIFEKKNLDGQLAVAKAEATMESYRRAKGLPRQNYPKQGPYAHPNWKPPPKGWLKMNVDAVVKSQEQYVGLGSAIRNHKGEFVAIVVKKSSFYGNVASAEAEAVDWGLEIAEMAACIPLIVESDCKEVVNLITGKKKSKLEIGWTTSEVQQRLKRLSQVTVQHTPRSCNSIAHSLASLALKVDEPAVWLGTYPPHLLYLFS
ncbi:hypothetical protein AB3S75_033166 [Citrus x aurantiifolia]